MSAGKGAFREIPKGLRKPLKKSGDDLLGNKAADDAGASPRRVRLTG